MAMARSVCSNKEVAASLLHRINISLITRRGYTAEEEQGVVSTGLGDKGRSTSHSHTVGKVEERPTIKQGSVNSSSSWGPDPLSGYYKPSDQVTEVDAVDLRELHHKEEH